MEVSLLGEVLYRDIEHILFRIFGREEPVVFRRDSVAIVEDVRGTQLFLNKSLATKKNITGKEVS